MRWSSQPLSSKIYLLGIYFAAVPFSVLCFQAPGTYSAHWLLLTIASGFVATISIRLPQISSIISMGDVFTILSLVHFGPGPALLTYWVDILAAHVGDLVRKHGTKIRGKVLVHRWAFNLACCSLSTWVMYALYDYSVQSSLGSSSKFIIGLLAIALSWFLVNTITLSLAVSFWMNRDFWAVWREGISLYLMNFLGSAAAAGLISLFYQQAGFSIFLLSIPIAVVLYQLYAFYIQKMDQAHAHIGELNDLYLQTIEALASAVDAKDRYTHGHIRRVQAYATELARCLGISDEAEVTAIRAGSLLHDIGKIAIPEYILNKPTALTETEYEKMKIHPLVGANILGSINFPYPVLPMVKYHHERWDGRGYPEGLSGEQIPLNARILALVDCYDALTTNRPYRAPMPKDQLEDFFKKESGKAYDPNIVAVFLQRLDQLEAAGRAVEISDTDLWGIRENQYSTPSVRKLDKVQPTLAYGKAMNATPEIQRQLYSVFEFARTDMRCLTSKDVLTFMAGKLEKLIDFDAAVFYVADLVEGSLVAEHAIGESQSELLGLRLALEQKLSGWVAANNQSLCNLPPFPDFLGCAEPKPGFQMSAIAPMNRQGRVLGTIALYRNSPIKFTEDEFRRLEIMASQTAIALLRCLSFSDDSAVLTDALTGLPSGYQLFLIFDQVAIDASRYAYPVAVLSIRLDDLRGIRRRLGQMTGDEVIRAAAKHLMQELRETDLLVRYANDEFLALNPRMTRDQAEALKSRLQNDLDQFRFGARSDAPIPLAASIGIAVLPEDGTDLESLLSVAEWRAREDGELRRAISRNVRNLPLH